MRVGAGFGRAARAAVVVAAAVAVAASLSACGAGDGGGGTPTVHGCVRPDSKGQLEGASCTDPRATGRVVAIEADHDCYDVDGVESQESGSGAPGALCLSSGTGPPKATPNVAKPGDCITDSSTDALRVPCSDPTAVHRVLASEKGTSLAGLDDECSKVAGTESTYTWKLQSTDPTFAKISRTIVLCLAPKGKDPASSPDTAQAGDCLARAGESFTKVACSAGNAEFRVLHRSSSTAIPAATVCRSFRGTTTSLSRTTDNLFGGYVLCLGNA
jgi:hypothetical protein